MGRVRASSGREKMIYEAIKREAGYVSVVVAVEQKSVKKTRLCVLSYIVAVFS